MFGGLFFIYSHDFYNVFLLNIFRFISGFGETDLQLQTKDIRLISPSNVCRHPKTTKHSARNSAVAFVPFKIKQQNQIKKQNKIQYFPPKPNRETYMILYEV